MVRSASKQKIVHEVYGFIKVYSDGMVERPPFPGGYLPACPAFVKGVASKDVTLDADLGLWARLFLPQSVASSEKKCPIVLHFHGGGLCSGTPAATSFHRFCSKMAFESESIWVSVDYRLAPEYRLPAAYEDAYAAFMWVCAQADMQALCAGRQGPHAENLHTHGEHEGPEGVCAKPEEGVDSPHIHRAQAEHGSYEYHTNSRIENLQTCTHANGALLGSYGHDANGFFSEGATCSGPTNNPQPERIPELWLHRYADFSKCFLAGESSGGTIVHYLTMALLLYKQSLVQIRGLLFIHAALLIRGVYDDVSHDPRFERSPDTYRSLCLPSVGAAWDHPLLNPLHAHAPSIDGIILPPAIVAVADQDKFCAPGKYYTHAMKQCGHDVELHVTQGQGHCFYAHNPRSKEAESLFKHLVVFMRERCKLQGHRSSL